VVRQNQNRGRAWRKGQRFDRRYAQNYREIDYRTYRGRGLYAPPRGHRWVRSGNDAVLIAIGSGLIGAVIGNAIR
jgi:Ni/Co efflux regulator RcnB